MLKMDIVLLCLIFLFFTHWVADFVVQGDNVERGTAGNDYIIEHCTKYAIFFSAGAWLVWLALMNTSFEEWLIFSVVNVGTHTLIDIFAIPIASAFFRKGNIRSGAISLALDQFLHSVVILTSFCAVFMVF